MQQQATLYQRPPSPSYPPPMLSMPAIRFAKKRDKMMASGAKAKSGIRLTERDAQILEVLYSVGYLTTHQIGALFFAESQSEMGPTKACQRRMRLLHAAELVRRIEQPVKRGEGSKPFIYALSKLGAEFLMTEIGVDPVDIDWQPQAFEANAPFLSHLLTTTDLRIALVKACKRTGIELIEWMDERALRMGKLFDYVTLAGAHGQPLKTAVIPDAIFVLERNGKRAVCLLECDMGTVTIEPSLLERKGWAKKVRTYEAYFATQAFVDRYEGRRARVLTVTSSDKRLTNLQKVTERIADESKSMFWFSTFERALDPAQLLTAPIWTVAGSLMQRSLLE